MARDLILGETARNWSRGSTIGEAGRPDTCSEHPRTGMGWFGCTMAAMFATRILSGRWPWHWFGLASKRLEEKR